MASDTVSKAFAAWTAGLGVPEARVSAFEHVRDIPFAVIPEFRNPTDGPERMLDSGRGSCTPKHFLLGRLFEQLGIPIRYSSFPYEWSSLDARLPASLRRMAESIPTEYHLALRAQIKGRWVLVDATWDAPLARAGFVVNAWDGESDTQLAVAPLEEVPHADALGRMNYVREQKAAWTPEEHAATGRFVEALNRWLAEVRRT